MKAETTGFFPPLLGVGSYDKGPGGPVQFLQRMLLILSCAVPGLVDHGRYDEPTAQSVAILQRRLQMIVDEPSRGFLAGIFDGFTRDALRRRNHIDFSKLPVLANGCVYIGSDGEPQEWPKPTARMAAAN